MSKKLYSNVAISILLSLGVSACGSKGGSSPTSTDISQVNQIKKLKEQYKLDTVLITRSEEGMTLYDGGIHNIPTYAKEVYDVTGAGDTVISVFTLARAAGATWEEAAKIANAAGGIVVGKIGTSTVSEKELISTYNSIYNIGGTCEC